MKLVLATAFLLSLCSISYQFLLVRSLDQFVQDEILSQSITLGFFLLMMGAGAAVSARYVVKKPLITLFWIEVLLAALGGSLLWLSYAGMISLQLFSGALEQLTHSPLAKVLALQPLTIIVGFLTGFEVPLLSAQLEIEKRGNQTVKVLASSYFGAIGGSFLVAFALAPYIDLILSGVVIGFLNLSAAAVILLLLVKEREARLVFLAPLFLAAAIQYGAAVSAPGLEQALLKTSYLELRLPGPGPENLRAWLNVLKGFAPVERYRSPYQNIDLIPDRFMLSQPEREDFALYLNMQPQFSRQSVRGYHESMVFGALNLSGREVKRALILGGGDGLLAAELLMAGVEEIVLVELDPLMIKLANEHPKLLELNRAALQNPKVKVIVADAFIYVRMGGEKFDGIFSDLPFPANYDLLKLYSKEFFTALKERLSPEGFIVFDAPLWAEKERLEVMERPFPQDIIVNTVRAAGFRHPFAFGPMEPFIFADSSDQPPAFNYRKLPGHLSGKTFFNLVALPWVTEMVETDPSYVNSVFRPRRIRW